MTITKGYYRRPGDKNWTPVDIPHYSLFSQLVGGYLEAAPVCPDVCTLYINEEGKMKDLPPNAVWLYDGKPWDVLVGTIVLVGPPDSDGDDTDATEDMTRTVDSMLRYL